MTEELKFSLYCKHIRQIKFNYNSLVKSKVSVTFFEVVTNSQHKVGVYKRGNLSIKVKSFYPTNFYFQKIEKSVK